MERLLTLCLHAAVGNSSVSSCRCRFRSHLFQICVVSINFSDSSDFVLYVRSLDSIILSVIKCSVMICLVQYSVSYSVIDCASNFFFYCWHPFACKKKSQFSNKFVIKLE